MIRHKKFKPTESLVLNYDNIWMLPTNCREYTAFCGDTQYTFSEEELNEVCDKINAIGCTSFRLSAEEIKAVIEQFKKENEL